MVRYPNVCYGKNWKMRQTTSGRYRASVFKRLHLQGVAQRDVSCKARFGCPSRRPSRRARETFLDNSGVGRRWFLLRRKRKNFRF